MTSLRTRLVVLLLMPMLSLMVFFTIENYYFSQTKAKNAFDNSLVILGLVIRNFSGNYQADYISRNLSDILRNRLNDEFFYYVSIDDGKYISGYSNPPSIHLQDYNLNSDRPYIFNGEYRGIPVRAVYFQQPGTDDSENRNIELTVWRRFDKQYEMQRELFIRSCLRMGALSLLIGLILWFGIKRGLYPLTALGRVIMKKDYNDLTKIPQDVPQETIPLVKAINDLFGRMEKSISRRESFLSNASHQLKTPLASIKAQAELADISKDPEKIRQHVLELVKLSDNTSHLAEQMLSLLKTESRDALHMSFETCNLQRLITDICKFFAQRAVSEERELIFVEQTESAPVVWADSSILSEGISNIIDNAFNYSKQKSAIKVSLYARNNFSEIWITDKGPGIPPEKWDKAMRRFTRLDSTEKKGCGLGFAIANEAAKIHQGRLGFFISEENHFSVWIKIPLLKKNTIK